MLLTGAVLRLPDGGLYVAEEGDLCDVEEEPRPGRVAEGEVGDDVADAERRVVQLHAADVAQRAHLARVLVLQHVPVAQKLRRMEREACSSANISSLHMRMSQNHLF